MKTTTLTVDIDYDPDATDLESLASAMDRLLETVLSTPGILDDYGDLNIGDFFVQEKKYCAWRASDFQEVAEELGLTFTNEEVDELANWIDKNNDAELGMNWDRIKTLISLWAEAKETEMY